MEAEAVVGALACDHGHANGRANEGRRVMGRKVAPDMVVGVCMGMACVMGFGLVMCSGTWREREAVVGTARCGNGRG